MSGRNRPLQCTLASLATLALAMVVATPMAGQPPQRQYGVASLGAADLATLVTRCGGAEPLEDSLELVRKHACTRGRSGAGEILAFEENRWFVYALAIAAQKARRFGTH